MSHTPSPRKETPVENKAASVPAAPDESEEVPHYDDAVIAAAFRWSAIGLVVLLAGAGVIYYMLTRAQAVPTVKVTALSAPHIKEIPAAAIPQTRFTDITRDAGIDSVHSNGAYGEKLLPETMGSGAAFFDFDGDGDQDLLLVSGTTWPWRTDAGTQPNALALYQNDGAGHFANVTKQSGLEASFYGSGVAVGDYDNDGKPDLFITAVGLNHLYHNEGGGRFRDLSASAGVAGVPGQWSTSAAWIDVENDGDLDLFVCNYVKWSKEIDLEVGYKLVGVGRAYGQPMNFEGSFPYLYRNEGNGRFVDVSASSGIQVRTSATQMPLAKSLGVAPIDLNRDGWIDLVVANDTVQNFAFTNRHDGTFAEVGAIAGLAFDSYGMTRGAMGIDSGYYRNDSTLAVAIGNFANEMTALYVANHPSSSFTDEAITEGVGPASRLLLKFGLFFFDYDLDGALDLLTANGHLEEEITKIQHSQQYAQPAQLFWNAGPTHPSAFVPVPHEKCGPDLFKPIVGRGSAFADIDGDGDLDALLTQVAGPPLLLRNDQNLGHHWIRLHLIGRKSNRDAIGAWIRVRTSSGVISRQIMPTRSYLSQSELPVTIGLGQMASVISAEIVWPSGVTQKLTVDQLPLDRIVTVDEADGIAASRDTPAQVSNPRLY